MYILEVRKSKKFMHLMQNAMIPCKEKLLKTSRSICFTQFHDMIVFELYDHCDHYKVGLSLACTCDTL